jgi:hypothetical protein
MRGIVLASVCAALACAQEFTGIRGEPERPLASSDAAHVLLFVRTDCPLTNRYSPELQRIAAEFSSRADFWLVYTAEPKDDITRQIEAYHLPGKALLDPHQSLARLANATVSPQAAVFDKNGRLTYSGRIDDRVAELGRESPVARSHDLEDAIAATIAGRPVANPRTHAVGCDLADAR